MRKGIALILTICLLLSLATISASAETTYSEAPEFATKVAAGELPAVKDRLPEDPLVVKAKDGIGVYGGTWRQAGTAIKDTMHHIGFYGGMQLVVWDTDGKTVVPNIASAYTLSEDAKSVTFTLRKGLKWSDGEPFGMEDVEFWWNDCLNNAELTPSKGDYENCTFTKQDDYTFTLTFEAPQPLILAKLAYANADNLITGGSTFFRPAHYLKQFHKSYLSDDELKAVLAQYGASDWVTLFNDRMDFRANKDLPMMSPFIMTVDPATTNQVTFARNPYYWAVDESGNQLPYLDGCVITLVESTDVAIMKAIAGEVDVQIATLAENFANYPLLAEHMDEQGYTLGTYDPNEPNAMNIMVNPASRDEDKRAVMSQKDFRVALSDGINREEIVASMWTVGPYAAKIAQSSPIESSSYYSEEMATQHTAFDPAAANALLDKLGMTSFNDAGYRLSPTGKDFSLVIQVPNYAADWIDVGEAVAAQWRENLKLNITATSVDPNLWDTRVKSNDFDISMETGSNGLAVLNISAVEALTGYRMIGWGNIYQAGAQIWRTNPDGDGAVEPDAGIKRLWEIGAQIVIEPDSGKRDALAAEMVSILKDNLYVVGIARRLPCVYLVKNNMRNVYPLTFNWDYGVSGNTRPEAYWMDAQ